MKLDNPAPGISIAQPERGFRYGSEAFWLVGFALEGGTPDRALDLGTGSGIAAMLLAGIGVQSTGIDVRSEWEPFWEQTRRASDVNADLKIGDVADGLVGKWPLIVSNPPFFPSGSGPVSPNPWKAAARTESTASLAVFAARARESLSDGGRACFVLPIERLSEIAHPQRIVRVGDRRVIVEFGREAGRCTEAVTIGEADVRVGEWYRSVGASRKV